MTSGAGEAGVAAPSPAASLPEAGSAGPAASSTNGGCLHHIYPLAMTHSSPWKDPPCY